MTPVGAERCRAVDDSRWTPGAVPLIAVAALPGIVHAAEPGAHGHEEHENQRVGGAAC